MQKKWLYALSISALITLLASCHTQNSDDNSSSSSSDVTTTNAKKELVIGTTVGDFSQMVSEKIKPILEKKGYSVKLVEFSDYIRPNIALADKDLDINVFQTVQYLNRIKVEHHLAIMPIFQVPTAPLGLYAGKTQSLDQIKDGATVGISNFPSDIARTLVILSELGWIKLKADVNPLTASKNDIEENTKNIKLTELDPAQLPRARADLDFAFINGNYAISSGIKLTDALLIEPSFEYVNWAAIRTADQSEPWLKDIEAAYNSDEFKVYIKERFPGYKLPALWENQATASDSQ